MNRKYERPEIKQITKQWVRENCKNITDRDLGLLNLIANRRIVRRDQIQTLYPVFPSADFLNKRLKILYNKHVIDRIYPPVGVNKGSAKQHICLDRAGAILLGMEKYNKPIHIDQNGQKALPLGWEHRIAINEYECRTKKICGKLGAKAVLIHTEKPYIYNDTRVIPDLTCVINHNNKGYVFFIEVDLGTEDLPYIKKKIDSYTDYYLSKTWLKEKWARIFKNPKFPRVLFMTEDGRVKRQNTLQEYTKESSIRFVIDFHENFESIVESIIRA